MREIYSSTKEGILWLGDFSENAEFGLGLVMSPSAMMFFTSFGTASRFSGCCKRNPIRIY
jgi:hypothetical protein